MKTPSDVLKAAGAILRDGFRASFREQGHHLTGTFEASMQAQVKDSGSEQHLTMLALAYGQIVNYGTKPSRIPYGGGGGGTSKYIQGLIGYFRKRGLSEKEATRVAFATAKKHKKEGMSTEASKRFSSTGQRQGFIEAASRDVGGKVDSVVLAGFDQLVDAKFHETESETI